MSLSHSPQIVRNGLILCLDAANKRSFNPSENLLTYTNSIGISGQKYTNNAAVITTLNAATAPDGTLTATKIDNNGNSTANYVYSQLDAPLSTSTVYTYSIFVRPVSSNLTYVTLDENDFGGKRYQMYFNIGNETVTTQTIGSASDGSILSSGVVKYPNNWYRIYITFKTGSTTVSNLVDMISRYSASNVGYNYFWGRQLEKGPVMTDYTPVLTTGIISRPTTWTDLSGNSNNGTLVNTPTYSSSNNGYFALNGSTGYVNVLSSSSITFASGASYSLSTWFYIASLPSKWTGIVTKSRSTSSWYGLWIDPTNRYDWASAGNGGQINLFGSAATTGWHNLCGVYNTSSNSALLYVDGILDVSTPISSYNAVGSSDLFIGKGTESEYLNGQVSSVSIYNRALSALEVRQNYSALKGRYSL